MGNSLFYSAIDMNVFSVNDDTLVHGHNTAKDKYKEMMDMLKTSFGIDLDHDDYLKLMNKIDMLRDADRAYGALRAKKTD